MLLVIWSANGDGSALTSKASSNLLNDDTYRFICAGNCVIHPRQIEQGTHYIKKILDLLEEENVSGESSGRASL